jgi:hypothetical protein
VHPRLLFDFFARHCRDAEGTLQFTDCAVDSRSGAA